MLRDTVQARGIQKRGLVNDSANRMAVVKKTDKSMKPRKNVERQEKLMIYEFSSEGII